MRTGYLANFEQKKLAQLKRKQINPKSHHIYPNTYFDLELTQFEPFAYFAVTKSSALQLLSTATILPLFMTIVTYFDAIKVKKVKQIGLLKQYSFSGVSEFSCRRQKQTSEISFLYSS